MFSLIVLFNFSESLATKCLSLNDEPCFFRPSLIDLNPVELKYYLLMINFDKCSESCNLLSPKICVLKETKDINLKAFNIVTNKYAAETMAHSFIRDHVTINNCYYFLSLCKT